MIHTKVQEKGQDQDKQWSINRNEKIKENIPNVISQKVVEEVLRNVGKYDWNDPSNVVKTISEIMSIDLEKPIEEQFAHPSYMDRTILTQSVKDKTVPFWICQSIIRIDEKFNNRYIIHEGSKYNKLDVIFKSEYFKNYMDNVAKFAGCTWNARWGGSKKEEQKLHRKTRPDANKNNETWLDKCVTHLLTEDDTEGINIKNLVMIEFRRD